MNIWQYFGIIVFIAGLLDGWKYHVLTNKIKKFQSAKGQSRMFTNIAVFHKVCLAIWAIFYLKDWVVALSTLLALYMSCELWYHIWIYYPFLGRGKFGYKRPGIIKYIINSLTPNQYAKKL